jgi:EAL domain-containing protein (putative c-di-GMP-specific phosphodiesterase class I)
VVETDTSMSLVGTAREAGEAVDLANRYRPDVALLDVRMPGGGGPVAARGIRRCSPRTEIIALSTFEAPESVMTMLEAGASGYVSKGDSTLEIVRAIRQCRQGKTALSGRIRDSVAEELAQQASKRVTDTPWAKRRARIQRFIDGEGLDIVFQPIVELQTGRVVAVEALSRFVWRPRRSPDAWFHEASAVGLGVPLELAAAAKALSSLGALPPSVCLSINFSPQALESAEFAVLVAHQPLDRLIVEVTEQTDASGSLSLEETLAPWRWGGLLVAVDDAGSGFSTLNRIVQLRPEFIKLDITMTRHIETDAARQLLVEKLQGFAAEVGATLIAEGIETDGQIDRLLSLGVGVGQGFRLGRPGPLPPVGKDGELVWKGRHAFEDRGRGSPAGDAITSASGGA